MGGVIALHTNGGSVLPWGWTLDPLVLALVVTASVLYFRGYRALARSGKRPLHGKSQLSAFYLGIATVAVALLSPLDHLADELFLAHMTQHLLLTLVAPPLILLGAPLLPLFRGIPRGARRAVVIPVARAGEVRFVLRWLTKPIVAWSLFIAMLFAWHAPTAYEAALHNEWIHQLEHFAFWSTALLFWWNVVDPAPLRSTLSYLARLPYTFIVMVPMFVFGAFATHADTPWYPTYALTAPAYGLTPAEDQEIAGLIMWIPSSFILLGVILIELAVTVRAEERKQRQIEQAEARAAANGKPA